MCVAIANARPGAGAYAAQVQAIYLAHGAVLLVILGLYNALGPFLPFPVEVPVMGLLVWVLAREVARRLRRSRWLRFILLGLPRGGPIPVPEAPQP